MTTLIADPATQNRILTCNRTSGGVNRYTIAWSDFANPLGKGSYGIIYKATDQNNKIVAIKQVIKVNTITKRLQEETQILKQISLRPNTKHLLYSIDITEDSSHAYFVMPYCDEQTLTNFIQHDCITSEADAIDFFRQICYGLDLLHSYKIMHRDLKTDNIMVSSCIDPASPFRHLLYIGDYGISKNELNSLNTMYVGTAFTRAPEVRTGQYGRSADIYSLGCIFYKILSKSEVFQANTVKEVEALQAKDTFVTKSHLTPRLSTISIAILEGCLQVDPKIRITMNELDAILHFRTMHSQYVKVNLLEAQICDQVICFKVFQKEKYNPLFQQIITANLFTEVESNGGSNNSATQHLNVAINNEAEEINRRLISEQEKTKQLELQNALLLDQIKQKDLQISDLTAQNRNIAMQANSNSNLIEEKEKEIKTLLYNLDESAAKILMKDDMLENERQAEGSLYKQVNDSVHLKKDYDRLRKNNARLDKNNKSLLQYINSVNQGNSMPLQESINRLNLQITSLVTLISNSINPNLLPSIENGLKEIRACQIQVNSYFIECNKYKELVNKLIRKCENPVDPLTNYVANLGIMRCEEKLFGILNYLIDINQKYQQLILIHPQRV